MRLTAGQSESLSVFTASGPSGPRRQKYSGIRNDSGNFVYLVSCTTVSLRPDCQAANLSLVIVTIAILSMISCPRFQKRCKGTYYFSTVQVLWQKSNNLFSQRHRRSLVDARLRDNAATTNGPRCHTACPVSIGACATATP